MGVLSRRNSFNDIYILYKSRNSYNTSIFYMNNPDQCALHTQVNIYVTAVKTHAVQQFMIEKCLFRKTQQNT